MHLLTTINNNVNEWRAFGFDRARPRLPLPYAFGAAFLQRGHSLVALDLSSKAGTVNITPFVALYHKDEVAGALNSVDIAALWGSYALRTIFRQAITPGARKNILYFTYAFAPERPGTKQRIYDWCLMALAGATRGLVVMTGEQARKAEEMLEGKTPVIRLRCGIDTAFYRDETQLLDIPVIYRERVEKLLSEPYVIMPGDELRFNDDAIRFVEQSGIRLVRVSQYGHKCGTDKLKRDVAERRLGDRLVVFEKIDYSFLRFLLRHASAYAGLVDSSWQPAGWTVACEALSSGLPMVLYEGLTSREMAETGVSEKLLQSVASGDVASFTEKLVFLVASGSRAELSGQATTFAAQHLDFGITAPAFVAEIENLVMARA